MIADTIGAEGARAICEGLKFNTTLKQLCLGCESGKKKPRKNMNEKG